MATSGAIRAGKAFVELFADTGKLGPSLAKGKDMVKGWAKDLNSSVGKVQGLTDSLEPLATKSTAVADAIDIVGMRVNALNGLSPAARGFANVATSAFKAADAVKQNAAAMALLGTGQTALSALLTPWGLIGAAAVAAGVALVKYTETGKQVYASSATWLGGLKTEALDTFSAIANAVEAGDLAAAWDVLQSTVEVVWDEAMIEVLDIWQSTEEKLIDGLYGVQEAASFAWDEIQKGWIDTMDAVLDAWKGFYDKFIGDSRSITDALAGTFLGSSGTAASNVLKEGGEDDSTAANGILDALTGGFFGSGGKAASGVLKSGEEGNTVAGGVFDAIAGAFLGSSGKGAAGALKVAGEQGPDEELNNEKKKQIDDEGRKRADDIRDQNKIAQDGLKADFEQRKKEAQERLRQAKERRANAINKAKGLSAPAATAEAEALGLDKSRESISGTFSANAAGRLGGGNLEQIATNTAQANKYLKQIAQSTPTIGFT